MGPKPKPEIKSPYRKKTVNGRTVYEHHLVAEAVLGRPLRGTEMVHHIDGNGKNNARDNLVICPDDAYHRLIHTRQDALEATGNCEWRRCVFCGKWDAPENLRFNRPYKGHSSPRALHSSCYNTYKKNNKHKWASAKPGYKPNAPHSSL